MKKIYPKTLILFLLAFGIKGNAQCPFCTINITGLDAVNHIVSSGQTLCVASTGTMTGLITISTGGILCNEGKINSTNLWVAGGTFNNYGTISTHSVLVSSAGTFTNYSTALIDSLLITQSNSTYVNSGTQTGTAFAVTDNASAINTGTINAYNMGDSLGTFINNGNLTITNFFANSYTSTCTNNGNLTVNTDFFNSYSGTFTNNAYITVLRDFFNATSANFTTKCMISVGRDWYNSANIYGPALTSCGGFSVTGGTYNSGILGSPTTHIDICDAGHPPLGTDGPGGTIAGTTTYCTCMNSCAVVTGIEEIKAQSSVLISTVYPNPTTNTLNIKLNNKENETLIIEVRDMMGKTVYTKTYQASTGENETDINVSALAHGAYILNITDSHKLQSNRLFNVSK
jgi:hypothetical protein